MSVPLISLIHATRGRPAKAVECMKLWQRMARWPAQVEYVFVCDNDDGPTKAAIVATLDGMTFQWQFVTRHALEKSPGSAPAWAEGYKYSRGDLLIQVSDDFEPPKDWDHLLFGRLPEDWQEGRYVVAVNDGYRKDRLMTMFICTRAYAEMQGEFICPLYAGPFSDDDVTYRAYANQRDGKCQVIEARDLTFAHHHHAADPRVPKDATYERQNRPQAYALGEELFKARNPDAMRDQQLWR